MKEIFPFVGIFSTKETTDGTSIKDDGEVTKPTTSPSPSPKASPKASTSPSPNPNDDTQEDYGVLDDANLPEPNLPKPEIEEPNNNSTSE